MSEPGTTAPRPGGDVSAAERMQALLARAAQEQIAEQRSVAASLAEVRAQVAAVGEGLRGAASGIALERLRSDVATVAAELRQSTVGIAERFDVLAGRIDEQAAVVQGVGQADLPGRLGGVAAEVSSLSGRLALVSRDVTGLTGRLDALAADLAQVSGAVEQGGAPVEAVQARLGELGEAVAAVGARGDALQRALAGMGADVAALGETVGAVPGLVSAVTAQVQALAARVEAGEVTEQVQALSGRLDQVGAAVTGLAGPLEAAAGRAAATAGRVEELERGVQALHTRVGATGTEAAGQVVAALAERFAELEQRLAGLDRSVAQTADRLSGQGELAESVSSAVTPAVTEAVTASVTDAVTASVTASVTEAVTASVTQAVTASMTELLTEALATLGARVERVAGDVTAQSAGLGELRSTLTALAEFPPALAALQSDLAGVHDRLAPLGDLRDGLADLQLRSAGFDALRGELQHLNAKSEGFATATDVHRLRDSVIAALTERIAGALPRSVAPDELDEALAPLHAKLDAAGQSGESVSALTSRVAAVEATLDSRLQALEERLAAAPAGADLDERVQRIADQLQQLAQTPAQLAGLTAALDRLPAPDAGDGELAALREEVETLGTRVSHLAVPSTDEVATAVQARLGDRLAADLTPQLTESVLAAVRPLLPDPGAAAPDGDPSAALLEAVREATAASEQRLRAHVDDAVLALAEALLRRRRSGPRPASSAVPALEELMSRPPSGTTGQFPIVAAPTAPAEPAASDAGSAAPAPAPSRRAARAAEPRRSRTAPPATPAAATAAAPRSVPAAPEAPAGPVPGRAPDVAAGQEVDGGVELLGFPTDEAEAPAERGRADWDSYRGPDGGGRGEGSAEERGTEHGHGSGREHDDEDDEAAARRRPWWRPGG